MKKLYLSVFASNLATLSYGLFFGWPSTSLPRLLEDDSPVPLTLEQATWVTSIMTLSGALGVVFCICTVNVIGRKWTLLVTAVPAVVGWLMIAFATSVWELYIGRFISGWSSSNGYIVVTMYTGEISPPEIRGTLTSALTVSAKIGMLIEWTIGPFLSLRDLALVSMAFPILFAVCMAWLPESPYHLMRRGGRVQAIKSLAQIRGTTDVSEEANVIEKSVKVDLANETGFRELLAVPGNRKALTVVLGLAFFQQFGGSGAIISYAELIFNATNNQFEGKYVTMIVGCVQVVCTIASTAVVDRLGRRTWLMMSALGGSFSTFLVGLFFFLQSIEIDVSSIVWLPAVGVMLFIFTYAFGMATLPFTLISELFPTNVKALGSALGIMSAYCFAFLVSLSYQAIAANYGIYTAFWMFAVISFIGLAFVYVFVPETKGKTLQEVQEKLHGRQLF